jgi:uncharacterized protein YegL
MAIHSTQYNSIASFSINLTLAFALVTCACLTYATPASLADEPIVLKSLKPVFDKLPERQLLKGSILQTEEAWALKPVNIFGFAGQAEGRGKGRITFVRPYTAAWRAGLSAGDRVVASIVKLPQALLTIERNGKRYSCLLETKQKLPARLTAKISESKTDQQLLAQYSIIMLIDSSASMQTVDCPGNVSRWQWCKDHVPDLYAADKRNFQNNISIVTFDSNYRSHRNCTNTDLPRIFQNTEPTGETYMAPALAEAFSLVHRQLSNGTPAIISVVSDGRPSDAEKLKSTIINEVNNLSKPELLSIVFIEVGSPEKYLKELDTELTKLGAKWDVVTVIPFSQANSDGLTHTLASTIPKPQPAKTQPTPTKLTISNTENKAKAAISAHIFMPSTADKSHSQAPAPVQAQKVLIRPQPSVKAHPTGISLEAKANSLPKEIDEKEQELQRNANKTYR